MVEEQVQILPSPFPFRPGSIGFTGDKQVTNTFLLSGSTCWWLSLFLLHSTLLHHRVYTPSEL
jgi:hypothetical protein